MFLKKICVSVNKIENIFTNNWPISKYLSGSIHNDTKITSNTRRKAKATKKNLSEFYNFIDEKCLIARFA